MRRSGGFPRGKRCAWTLSSGGCSRPLGKRSKMLVPRPVHCDKRTSASSSVSPATIMAACSFPITARADVHTNSGGTLSIAANRISYLFDLKGPSVSVDTACSSALVAISLACKAVWSGDCDAALAGGVNALITPHASIGFSKATMLSPSGKCYAFDERADGYVRSEGAGLVYLKPLSQALASTRPDLRRDSLGRRQSGWTHVVHDRSRGGKSIGHVASGIPRGGHRTQPSGICGSARYGHAGGRPDRDHGTGECSGGRTSRRRALLDWFGENQHRSPGIRFRHCWSHQGHAGTASRHGASEPEFPDS